MRNENLPDLSDGQLEIMSVVWDRQTCLVSDVLRELQKHKEVTRNTVHTMMTRLVDKGWLMTKADGGRFVYSASVGREVVQQKCVDQMVDTVFDGSAEGLLLSLLHNRKLSRDEATRIRRMIREAEERP